MVTVTHESYDSVLAGTGNRKVLNRCLKTASDGADATWRGSSKPANLSINHQSFTYLLTYLLGNCVFPDADGEAELGAEGDGERRP